MARIALARVQIGFHVRQTQLNANRRAEMRRTNAADPARRAFDLNFAAVTIQPVGSFAPVTGGGITVGATS